MAEGYLSQSKGNKSMDRLGHPYFEELKSRSFFQHPIEDGKLGYKMHDLINDLATSVAGEFSFRSDVEMDVSYINETLDKFRHFSLVGLRSESYKKLNELERSKRLRTFLMMSVGRENDGLLDDVLVQLLPKLQSLRVLSVMELTPSYYRSNGIITKVPQSIGSLKHLRYLNFSFTRITCLPEQVSSLYNLQSLLVQHCYSLSSLPESFAKLIKLQHLDNNDTTKLIKLPLGIAWLTSLRTLPKIIVEEANGFKISDLKDLSNLQGHLSIIGLEKVIDQKQARNANLHQKKGLDVLEMQWSYLFHDSRNEEIEYEVLTELRPPPKLKRLKILYNKGTKFPSWVSDPLFDQLTELMLLSCRSTHLPTLGHLQSLKKLVIQNMSEVKTVGFELLAPPNSFAGIAFLSLEVLDIYDMQGWEKWSIDIGGDLGTSRSFPRLHEISITHCPKLAEVSIRLIPSLRILRIQNCPNAVFKSLVGLSSSLFQLQIIDVKGLTQLYGEDLMHLGALEHLYIGRCDDLRYLWERDSEACKSLLNLQAWNCKMLVSSAEKEDSFEISMKSAKVVKLIKCDKLEGYNCPNSVERLNIEECSSMKSLTFSAAVQEHPSSVSESMSRLKSLAIRDCKNLNSFTLEHLHSLAALREMVIVACPSMDYSFPCGLWPPNLRLLRIGGLNKPMSEWGVQKFPPSLVELHLNGENSGVVSFAVADEVRNTSTIMTPSSSSTTFLLPPSLVSLYLYDFEDVESFSEVLQHLPCLKRLYISTCPEIRDIKAASNPSNLKITVK